MSVLTVAEIAAFLRGKNIQVGIEGDMETPVRGFCSLSRPEDGAITWIRHAGDGSLAAFGTCESLVVVAERWVPSPCPKTVFLLTEEPRTVYFSILTRFFSQPQAAGVASSAVVRGTLAKGVSVGEGTYIGEDVQIGAGTVVEHNVSIYNRVRIGKNCIIHSGAVIGADGYGFYVNDDGSVGKVPHFGGVIIGDEVEIGANACIDRGTLDDTEIGDSVKIDNLVHIAHNVRLGPMSMVVAGGIVCGSAELEDHSYVGPGGIVRNQRKLGANALVGLGAVVTQSVESNAVVAGIPAKKIRERKKDDI